MSLTMKLGEVAFRNWRRVWFCSPASGCDRRPTRKTLFRKHSSNSGGAIITSTRLHLAPARQANAACSTRLFGSTALDFIRRDSRRARREQVAFSDVAGSVEPEFQFENETQQALVAALDDLPRDQREVLVMKIWNELTFAEIGSALGISHNTAASRYRYALAGLKKTLQPQ